MRCKVFHKNADIDKAFYFDINDKKSMIFAKIKAIEYL